MNKALFLFLSIAVYTTTNYAQNTFSFGVKAAINYNSNGKLIAQENPHSLVYVDESTGRVGYSIGMWARKSFLSSPVYLQSELQYTQTKSTYKGFYRDDYLLNKIETPLLIGFKVAKIGTIFLGPNLQFIVDSSFGNIAQDDIETDSFSLASHIGIGIKIGKLGADVRWEKGLSKTKSLMLSDTIYIDSKPNQLIFSLNFQLN